MPVADGWFSPPLPRLIAHRGLTFGPRGEPRAVENTELAFRRALDAGATHLETDVRATADGHAVLVHDPDLGRIAGAGIDGAAVEVSATTLADLVAIPLDAGGHVCTLRDLLARFPDARINLDVKSADAIRPTIDAIREARAESRCLITSFSGRRRRAALRDLPGASTSASSGGVLAALVGARLGIAALVRLAVRDIDALQIPSRYGPFRLDARRTIARLHAAGIEVHYWTVNDPAVMRRLVADGADGVITDRVDVAESVLHAGPPRDA